MNRVPCPSNGVEQLTRDVTSMTSLLRLFVSLHVFNRSSVHLISDTTLTPYGGPLSATQTQILKGGSNTIGSVIDAAQRLRDSVDLAQPNTAVSF